jgi:putative addiction module killer protein
MNKEFHITFYQDNSGEEPFSSWFFSQNWRVQNIIIKRLNRIKLGNFGDCKSLGDKVYELRIHESPGYRIYFSREESYIIIILCAGIKSTQSKDIKKAKNLLKKFYEKRN